MDRPPATPPPGASTPLGRTLWALALLLAALGLRAWRVTPDPAGPAPPPVCARWVQVGAADAPLRCLPWVGPTAPRALQGPFLPAPCLAMLHRVGLVAGDRLVPDPSHPAGCRRTRMRPALIRTLRLPVAVNRAGPAELETLPGVGPALARRIVAARERDGSFRRPADLTRVKGIGPRLAARLAPRLSF